MKSLKTMPLSEMLASSAQRHSEARLLNCLSCPPILSPKKLKLVKNPSCQQGPAPPRSTPPRNRIMYPLFEVSQTKGLLFFWGSDLNTQASGCRRRCMLLAIRTARFLSCQASSGSRKQASFGRSSVIRRITHKRISEPQMRQLVNGLIILSIYQVHAH